MKEAWNDFYTEAELLIIQRILIRSLDVFDALCKKLNIEYYLYGGSMLGALKYQGFVPWDDDLDVCLKREDYEVLLREGPKYLDDNYELQHPSNCKKSPYHYIKFRRKGTALVEEINSKIKINHGIYLDIYPLDNIPDCVIDYMSQKIAFDKWIRRFQLKQNFRVVRNGSPFKVVSKQTIRMIQHMFYFFVPVRFFVKKIHRISTKYNSINTVRKGNLSFPLLLNYYDNNSKSVKIQFEGRTLQLPKGFEVNVKNRYGDISLMPPKSKRVGHMAHILDLGQGDVDNAN